MTENLLFIFHRELKRANYTQDYEYYSIVCACVFLGRKRVKWISCWAAHKWATLLLTEKECERVSERTSICVMFFLSSFFFVFDFYHHHHSGFTSIVSFTRFCSQICFFIVFFGFHFGFVVVFVFSCFTNWFRWFVQIASL